MEAKHTPGPWIVSGKILTASENDRGFRILAESGSGWRWIADSSPVILNERGEASAEGEANARLIAAAPDLLEELRRCIALIEGEVPASAIAAIEKATRSAS